MLARKEEAYGGTDERPATANAAGEIRATSSSVMVSRIIKKFRTHLFAGSYEPSIPALWLVFRLTIVHTCCQCRRYRWRRRRRIDWKKLLAYITGSVDQELLLRNKYLLLHELVNVEAIPYEVTSQH
jgi:hypothetical protein